RARDVVDHLGDDVERVVVPGEAGGAAGAAVGAVRGALLPLPAAADVDRVAVPVVGHAVDGGCLFGLRDDGGRHDVRAQRLAALRSVGHGGDHRDLGDVAAGVAGVGVGQHELHPGLPARGEVGERHGVGGGEALADVEPDLAVGRQRRAVGDDHGHGHRLPGTDLRLGGGAAGDEGVLLGPLVVGRVVAPALEPPLDPGDDVDAGVVVGRDLAVVEV